MSRKRPDELLSNRTWRVSVGEIDCVQIPRLAALARDDSRRLATSRLTTDKPPRLARLTYESTHADAEDHCTTLARPRARGAHRWDSRRAGEGHAAQRVVRSDARAVQGHQRRVRSRVEAAHGAGRGDQAVARRLGGAGARGDRRAG